jgi:hypothetical protein
MKNELKNVNNELSNIQDTIGSYRVLRSLGNPSIFNKLRDIEEKLDDIGDINFRR